MKAYVIKNKEGKYVRGTGMFFGKEIVYWADDIIDAMPYEEDELKMLECPKDCTIVPITICEGDLEEENRVLKKALKLACTQIWAMSNWENSKPEVIEDAIQHFIQQAKESEKDE